MTPTTSSSASSPNGETDMNDIDIEEGRFFWCTAHRLVHRGDNLPSNHQQVCTMVGPFFTHNQAAEWESRT